jgi:hypothetical protein
MFWLSFAFAAFLLACAAIMIVWHVRSWRSQLAAGLEAKELDYRRRQFRRRMQSSGLMGIIALSLPVGVSVLREWPKVGVFFWGVVMLLLGWVVILAVADIWATKYFFGKLRDSYQLEKTRLEAELRRVQGMQDEARRSQIGPGNGKPPGSYPGVTGQGPETKP